MICSITFVGTGWPTCTSLDPPSVPFWKSDICSLPVLKDVSQWPWPFKGSWEWPQSDKSELPQYSWYILSGLLDLSLCSLLKCSLTWSFSTHCVLLAPDFSFTLRHLWLKANLTSQDQGKGDMEFLQFFLCHLSPAPLPHTAAAQYFSWSSFCYWCTFRSPSCWPLSPLSESASTWTPNPDSCMLWQCLYIPPGYPYMRTDGNYPSIFLIFRNPDHIRSMNMKHCFYYDLLEYWCHRHSWERTGYSSLHS